MSSSVEVAAPEAPVQRTDTINTNGKSPVRRIATLGAVRQRDQHTNEIILIPTPSTDPNDPLNWSQPFKYYMAVVICLAMLMCNFLAAGPSVAIVQTAMDFNPGWMKTGLTGAISRVAYFFTTTALFQGLGNLIWMPLVNKYGRRPIYIASYTLYLASAIWAACTYTYGSFLAARIVLGFSAGAAETMAPLSIADVFFLHERGAIMAMYTASLSCGVAFGFILSGLITIHHSWRVIYWVAVALIAVVLVLAIFTFPETSYRRGPPDSSSNTSTVSVEDSTKSPHSAEQWESKETGSRSSNGAESIPKKSYVQRLKVFSGSYTDESLFKMFFRPFALILLPPVLWVALVEAVTIGFLVAISSNVASAYQATYAFEPWQVGLCFIAAIVGASIGIYCGGQLGDLTADWLTKRNHGMREPEMRLPSMTISLITMPLALLLYGAGIQYKIHWMCPTFGLALISFAIVQATNVALVYVIDAYRPIAGEVVLTCMCFKSAFGFLLSFYTNPWIDASGYMDAFGAMAGISAAILLMWVVFYFWGKRIRFATFQWRIMKVVHWHADREVGE